MDYITKIKLSDYKRSNRGNPKYNNYDLTGDYGVGYLADGTEFYFDLEDYNKIKDFYWQDEHGYLRTNVRINKKHTRIYLHRLIANPDEDKVIDHINCNRRDNRKNNLRSATQTQNTYNKAISSKNKSGRTGVFWLKNSKKWMVNISYKNKSIYIGVFEDKQQAIEARRKAEDIYYGEYAYARSQEVSKEWQVASAYRANG